MSSNKIQQRQFNQQGATPATATSHIRQRPALTKAAASGAVDYELQKTSMPENQPEQLTPEQLSKIDTHLADLAQSDECSLKPIQTAIDYLGAKYHQDDQTHEFDFQHNLLSQINHDSFETQQKYLEQNGLTLAQIEQYIVQKAAQQLQEKTKTKKINDLKIKFTHRNDSIEMHSLEQIEQSLRVMAGFVRTAGLPTSLLIETGFNIGFWDWSHPGNAKPLTGIKEIFTAIAKYLGGSEGLIFRFNRSNLYDFRDLFVNITHAPNTFREISRVVNPEPFKYGKLKKLALYHGLGYLPKKEQKREGDKINEYLALKYLLETNPLKIIQMEDVNSASVFSALLEPLSNQPPLQELEFSLSNDEYLVPAAALADVLVRYPSINALSFLGTRLELSNPNQEIKKSPSNKEFFAAAATLPNQATVAITTYDWGDEKPETKNYDREAIISLLKPPST